MLRIMNEDSKSKVMEIEVEGKITRENLLDVYKEVEEKGKEWGEINFLEKYSGMEGIEPMAIVDDFRLFFKNKKYFKKAALVTDTKWVATLTKLFAPFYKDELKVFPMNEMASARQWLAA